MTDRIRWSGPVKLLARIHRLFAASFLMCVTPALALAPDSDSPASREQPSVPTTSPRHPYTAPDGRILERWISVEMPKRTIVVCSDEPIEYLRALRNFADYVMADMRFEFVDGREPRKLRSEDTTYIYMGRFTGIFAASDCLKLYPELESFVAEKRHDDTDIAQFLPKDMPRTTLSKSHFDHRQDSKNANSVFFCLGVGKTCQDLLVPTLFGLEGFFCDENVDVCTRLLRH